MTVTDFQREERYLVVKLSDFHTEQDEEAVRGWLRKFGVPTHSLNQVTAKAQVEAMLHVAKWLSGEIEEDCIGLELGGEISGPTSCSSADKCRVAGERVFKEAARIWEAKFVAKETPK